MKQNAPWQDRTGAARKSLIAEAKKPDKENQKYYEAKERQAAAIDAEMLDYYNWKRRSKNQIEWSKLPPSKMEPRNWLPVKGPVTTLTVRYRSPEKLPYVVWLEIGNNGRYSILPATIDFWGPKIMKGVQGAINLRRFDSSLLNTKYFGATLVTGKGIRHASNVLEKKTYPGRHLRGRKRKGRGRPQSTFDYNLPYY